MFANLLNITACDGGVLWRSTSNASRIADNSSVTLDVMCLTLVKMCRLTESSDVTCRINGICAIPVMYIYLLNACSDRRN